jgi:uncharacterized protein
MADVQPVTAAEPFPIWNNTARFDVARVHFLRRGGKLLAMDRRSGKWLFLPAEYEAAVRLLAAESVEALPARWRVLSGALRDLLERHQIGTPSERSFDSFNTLILKLTKACNIGCAYCYDWESGDKARHMDTGLALRAVAQALDGCAGKLCIILHGGEPTLAWDLIEKVTLAARLMARQRGVALSILGQTNMMRWTPRMVEFSRRHGIAWGISVDGSAEINDQFRVTHEGRGTYRRFEENLARYPDFVKRCGVLSTITAANDSKLLQLARHFRDLGMPSWDWSLFQPIGRGRTTSSFAFDAGRLLAAWSELFDAVVAGEFDGFAVRPVLKYLQNFVRGPGGNMCMRSECGAARDLLSVSHDGTIEACDCIDPGGPLANLGHLSTLTLAESRQSAAARRIRSRDADRLGCGECIWYAVCGGTCMAHAGDIDRIWGEACQLSLLAFDRISESVAESDRLLAYRASCRIQ